jgi:hypothetical protein
MNIFELASLAVILASGYFAGRFLGGFLGIPGWILGFVVGSGLVVTGFWALSRRTDGFGRWKKDMNAEEVAGLIERFLDRQSLYPQEWNDFVDTSQQDPLIDAYRKQCDELDPLVNCPGEEDPDAVARLRKMIQHLRSGRYGAPDG